MDGDSSRNQFEGKNRVSAILITLFLSFFAIAIIYILYRQFSGSWERPGVSNPWRDAFARTLDQNEKPILWDVHSRGEKLEWEWGGFKVSEWFRLFHATFGCGLIPGFRPFYFASK